MARREAQDVDATSARALLGLADSWEDDRDAGRIARAIRAARLSSHRSPAPGDVSPDTDTIVYLLKGHPEVRRNLALHPDDVVGTSAMTLMENYRAGTPRTPPA
ncbi:MAG: hypothetical protein M5U22_09225 [Thermoleophilia bacterium]|nr:hypothetical protein [Thermoleophilia bacterium]